MTLYISGPITGIKFYRRNFRRAEKYLTKKGFTVVNPVNVGDTLNIPKSMPEALAYKKYMKADLHAMLSCDGIVLLSGWESSKGAKMEKYVAEECGLKIFKQGEL